MNQIENGDVYPREFNIAEIIEISWNFFVKHFYPLLLISLISIIPLIILFMWLMPWEAISLFVPALTGQGNNAQTVQELNELFSGKEIVNFAIYGSLITIATYLVMAVEIQFVYASIYKGGISIREAIIKGLKALLPIIASLIMFILISIPSFVLFIIPFIMFGVYGYFFVYAASIRKKWGWTAIKYSFMMVQGRWWRTLGMIITFGLLNALIVLAVQIPSIMFIHDPRWLMSIYYTLSAIASIFNVILLTVMAINYEDTTDFSQGQEAGVQE